MKTTSLVSIHGGHSGQFCLHATDTLEDIVKRYIDKGYQWVGITEHIPPHNEDFYYPDQIAAAHNPEYLLDHFGKYIRECRRLQKKYKPQIEIFVALETETFSGYKEYIPFLINKFQPDYLVGSLHSVNNIGFDYSPQLYDRASRSVGGMDALYCKYFDDQHEMITILKPAVIGHFDLIRIHDPNYQERLNKPIIMARIARNLQLIKKYDLIMDLNLRPLAKGGKEPYISRAILQMVHKLQIPVVVGDDSHGLPTVGAGIKKGIALLEKLGFNTNWRKPKLFNYPTELSDNNTVDRP